MRQQITEFNQRLSDYQLVLNALPAATELKQDNDISSNVLAEGILLKTFTAFENFVEWAFLHYCTGGKSLAGFVPVSRLSNCNVLQARNIIKSGQRYIDWSSAETVRGRADLFLEQGQPIRSGIDPKSGDLSDVEKLRNMIAHDSAEAEVAYNDVLVRTLNAEPVFRMSPGQYLRIRRKKKPLMTWGSYYIASLNEVGVAIANR